MLNLRHRLVPFLRNLPRQLTATHRRSVANRLLTMASKLSPFVLRTCVRSAARFTRPQARAFSVTVRRPSDTLSVVSIQSNNQQRTGTRYDRFNCLFNFLFTMKLCSGSVVAVLRPVQKQRKIEG